MGEAAVRLARMRAVVHIMLNDVVYKVSKMEQDASSVLVVLNDRL